MSSIFFKLKPMFLILIFSLTFSINDLISQNKKFLEELKNNNDIEWIGEYESYMPFEISSEYIIKDTTFSDSYKYILQSAISGDYRTQDVYNEEFRKNLGLESFSSLRLKEMYDPTYLNKTNNYWNDYFYSNPLIYYLFNPVKEFKITAYKDSDLNEKLNESELEKMMIWIDTVIVVDSETYEEKMEVIINEIDLANEVQFAKVKYYLYYNSKFNKWNVYVKSISPSKLVRNEMGEITGYKELFWLPVDNIDKKIDYLNSNILYAKETRTRVKFENSKKIKALNSYDNCNKNLLDYCKLNSLKVNLCHPGTTQLMNESEIKNLGIRIDTVYKLDPVTFKENYKVIKEELDPKMIKQIYINQSWYFDRNKHRLQILNTSFEPYTDFLDIQGNVKFRAPLFKYLIVKEKVSKKKNKSFNK